MGNRCTQSILGVLFLSLTGCHHCWLPTHVPYDYGYTGCVDYCGYDCVYDYDLPGGRRHRHHGHMMRQPCPCCGRPMPAGMMGMGDCFSDCCGCGCFDMCGMGCGGCYSDCGMCCSSCGDCYSGMCGGSSCGNCGNCGTYSSDCPTYSNGQTCDGGWQSSQYSDCNTGWQDTQSQPSTQDSQPMAPTDADEYYVPSEPQPTEASGAQFLMPMSQQGNAVQPILWAPPTR